jgi:septum formation protein
MRLILASASPRRAELLDAAGIDFDPMPAHVDETVQDGESPERYVRRLADAKACGILARSHGRPVVAADTVVVVDGQILGKPVDANDARRMLRMLSGRQHEVVTAVSVSLGGPDDVCPAASAVERTTVEFAALTDAEIAWYVESGEPMDKAGAYAIQGLASRFVTRIEGSYSNVVGLPVALVYKLLNLGSLAD